MNEQGRRGASALQATARTQLDRLEGATLGRDRGRLCRSRARRIDASFQALLDDICKPIQSPERSVLPQSSVGWCRATQASPPCAGRRKSCPDLEVAEKAVRCARPADCIEAAIAEPGPWLCWLRQGGPSNPALRLTKGGRHTSSAAMQRIAQRPG